MRYAAALMVIVLALGGCISEKLVQVEKEPEQPGTLGTKDEPSTGAQEGSEAGEEMPPEEVNTQPPLAQTEVKEYTESILSVIESLEECYRTGDLEKWKSLLTPSYKEKYNDPEFLSSEGWKAQDLRSFFKLLIKTRRQGNVTSLEVSRVDFVKPDKALVYVILGNVEFPQPQHTFVMIGNSWLKGLPEEGE